MAGTSNYPGALDNFAEASPTNLGDEDSTGRTHSERHDDVEAAMEAVQEELGTDPSGASASTVAARFTSIESAYLTSSAASATYLTQASAASTYLTQSSASSTYVNRSVVTTAGDLIVATGSASVTRLGKGTEGYVLTSSSAGAQGLIWAEASGGATVEMSATEPVSPDNGTLWVDTDSDVATFSASAYVANSIMDAKGDILAATADNTPARLAVGSNGQVLVAASGEATGLIWQGPAEVIGIAVSDEETAITTGTAKVTFRMPFAMTLTAVRASLTVASSSGLPTFDINEGGSTILSTKLSIDATEKTSTTAATAAVISDSALADDAEITIDIDVAGTGAKGAKVYLIGRRA